MIIENMYTFKVFLISKAERYLQNLLNIADMNNMLTEVQYQNDGR